ncbi:hypothetical protein OG948_21390 [Embleya sp. NBC_00888]|uniref:hypothetical protein n=1 Tax=Embleya sp. NBC_00888 TaxID=2975960 RepID=UPI00386CB6C7|nr:hypothetical protein OG948_21390 [Embleya sp. NBC_00888]
MTTTVVVADRGILAPARPATTTPDGGAVLVAAPTIESTRTCPTCVGTPRVGLHTRTGWWCWVCREVTPWA